MFEKELFCELSVGRALGNPIANLFANSITIPIANLNLQFLKINDGTISSVAGLVNLIHRGVDA